MTEPIEDWLKKAEEDYWAAVQLSLARKHPGYNAICFHAQQCVEKYLKGILQQHASHIRKIHILQQLLDDCLQWYPMLEVLRSDLLKLSEYAVAFRYPGESADKQQAREAIRIMISCRTELRHALGLTSANGKRKNARG
jgi:HEPN domain-containing protein